MKQRNELQETKFLSPVQAKQLLRSFESVPQHKEHRNINQNRNLKFDY